MSICSVRVTAADRTIFYKMSKEGQDGPPPRVEFLVEPFVEGAPGPHVEAAVAAFTDRGVEVDVGPFASSATTDPETLADAVAAMVRDALAAGATRLRIEVGVDGERVAVGGLHDALGDMVRDLERELGPAGGWDRATKQAAVRMLSERGAFLLRGAVEDVAEVMGVSRITIYNYLNAIDDTDPR